MNMPCNGDFEGKINASGMTLSDLHRSEKEVLKTIRNVIKEEKYYNGTKKNAPVKMK